MSRGVVVVFRSIPDPEHAQEYAEWQERIDALLPTVQGFRSIKSFVAEDGERCSVSEFDSIEDIDRWKAQAEHMQAQALGKQRFYLEYSYQTCDVLRAHEFRRAE